ncbi:LOW QUALITY PROTEIN: serine/threonine-protein kinase LMTK1 [Tachyglossus aculeatus]|uniref:LOW QUALITY PROTEIN: serine/threonine-protein kinase LMTK1 n=1 Tax=Tachyglossus aculeatus TaxID=9261 RepID=UPI0018F3D1B2|nr:LOW QUALITY PROTEIN: serine/threonine-protein kinase LMTK1 [Tachyglossus aculeatus]
MLACLCCKKRGLGFKELENAEGEAGPSGLWAQGSPPAGPGSGPDVYVLPLDDLSLPMARQPGTAAQLLKSTGLGRHSLLYLKEIGHGWFGKVFLGEVNSGLSSTQVVVKELKASASVGAQMQFLEEAQPYRALQHGNLVQCLAQCAEVTPYLLVMEFCPLGDVKGYLWSCRLAEAASGPDPRALQRMACEVSCGLLHLHRNNYVHGDLALRNCLLTADLTVKVGDYGLAHCKYRDDYFVTADQLWVPLRWIAPELVDEVHGNLLVVDQTKASNVWSLGVTLWELFELGGQPYPQCSDRQVLALAIKEQQLKLPKPRLGLALSDRWYEVMQFCWLLPGQRPTADEVHLLLSYLCARGAGGPHQDQEDFEARWNALKPGAGLLRPDPPAAAASSSSFPLLEHFASDGEDVLTVTRTSRGLDFDYRWEPGRAPAARLRDLCRPAGPEDSDGSPAATALEGRPDWLMVEPATWGPEERTPPAARRGHWSSNRSGNNNVGSSPPPDPWPAGPGASAGPDHPTAGPPGAWDPGLPSSGPGRAEVREDREPGTPPRPAGPAQEDLAARPVPGSPNPGDRTSAPSPGAPADPSGAPASPKSPDGPPEAAPAPPGQPRAPDSGYDTENYESPEFVPKEPPDPPPEEEEAGAGQCLSASSSGTELAQLSAKNPYRDSAYFSDLDAEPEWPDGARGPRAESGQGDGGGVPGPGVPPGPTPSLALAPSPTSTLGTTPGPLPSPTSAPTPVPGLTPTSPPAQSKFFLTPVPAGPEAGGAPSPLRGPQEEEEEEEDTDSESDEELRCYDVREERSEDSGDGDEAAPVVVAESPGARNLRSLLKLPGLLAQSLRGQLDGKKKAVSFFDDVTVYLFDQESPTREPGEPPRPEPEEQPLRSTCPPGGAAGTGPEEGGGGVFEWDDDFALLPGKPAFASPLLPPAPLSRFTVSPASRFSITHVSDSAVKSTAGSSEDGDRE